MFLFHIRSFFSCVATYTRAGLFLIFASQPNCHLLYCATLVVKCVSVAYWE
uniref:Uncharacterized protein n=1 Tax=Anguilla anguilla TaxID=7936 RepID=A0A0E9V4N9_ANGAN